MDVMCPFQETSIRCANEVLELYELMGLIMSCDKRTQGMKRQDF